MDGWEIGVGIMMHAQQQHRRGGAGGNDDDSTKLRTASLKVSHYPVLLRKKAHGSNESAGVKWTTGSILSNKDVIREVDMEPWSEGSSRDRFFGNIATSSRPPMNSSCCANAENDDGMLHPRQKYSLTLAGPLPSTSMARATTVRDRGRKHWSGTPSAFHQSFDDRLHGSQGALSSSCGNLTEQVQRAAHAPYRRRAAFCSGDTSKGAFAGGYGSGNNSATGGGSGYSPGNPSRPPALGGRSPQSSFDSNGDVGQISLNFMRVNGSIAPFKTLLSGSTGKNTAAPSPPVALNVACSANGSGPTTTTAAATTVAAAYPSGNGIARVGSCHSPLTQESLTRRKESWPGGRKASDPVRISVEGDQLSKKSLSLVPSEDLEGGRAHDQDDSRTPLMKENEKGGRLIQRQQLFHIRRVTSDYALFFAVLGIVMMVLENELSAAHVYTKNSTTSLALKTAIVLSTAVLLALVVKFHVHEVELFMNANSAEDWRIAVTWRRCFQVAIELAVCAVCPVPLDLTFSWTTVHPDGETVTTTLVPLDVMLSIPMFARLYWLIRVMLLHSRLFTDASSRSIAGLNRVTFNARFIVKTMMTLAPGTMLMVFTASLWVLAGWVLRLCERHHVGEPVNTHALKHQNYLNSLWMIAITFLSVGYGDIVPVTYCGRGVAVITGILGTCTSSMVVAVIARKLELTRAERHVHSFMIDTQLTKMLKHSAANVLRETWLIYKYRRLVDKIDPSKIRHHQRKFLTAIYALRKVKRDQRKLAENSVSLGDVAKTTSNSYELIHDIHSTQEGLALRMTAVEHTLSDIQREIGQLADVMRSALGSQRRPSTELEVLQNPVQRDSFRRRRGLTEQ